MPASSSTLLVSALSSRTYTPEPKWSISIRRLHKACSPKGQPVHCPSAVQDKRWPSNTKGARGDKVSPERNGVASREARKPHHPQHEHRDGPASWPESPEAARPLAVGQRGQAVSQPVGQGARAGLESHQSHPSCASAADQPTTTTSVPPGVPCGMPQESRPRLTIGGCC